MAFLVVVLSLIVIHFFGALPSVQRDQWYHDWVIRLQKKAASGKSRVVCLVFSLALPVLGVAVTLWLVEGSLFGLPPLLLNTLFLLYSLGRSDISLNADTYMAAVSRGDLQAAYHNAAAFNINYREGVAQGSEEMHREVLSAISYRYFEHSFAVIFWFFLLGAPAAVLYRLSELHRDMDLDGEGVKQKADRWLILMEWLPARLMGISMAVVGNFYSCFKQWQHSLGDVSSATAEVLQRYVEGAIDVGDGGSPETLVADVVAVKALYSRALVLVLCVLAIVVIFG